MIFCFQAEDGIRDIGVTGVQTCAFFISSRRRHTRYWRDWSSDVCSSDLGGTGGTLTVAGGATLLAKGNVTRPVAGAGTITANNAPLILGDLGSASGFNLN